MSSLKLKVKIEEPWVKIPWEDKSTGVSAYIMKVGIGDSWILDDKTSLNKLISISGCLVDKENSVSEEQFSIRKKGIYKLKDPISIDLRAENKSYSVEDVRSFMRKLGFYPLNYVETLYLLGILVMNHNIDCFKKGISILNPIVSLCNKDFYREYKLRKKVYNRIAKISPNQNGCSMFGYIEYERGVKLLLPPIVFARQIFS